MFERLIYSKQKNTFMAELKMEETKNVKNNAIIMAELMFKMEKTCHLKEALFCSRCGLSPIEFRCIRELLENLFPSIRELSVKMDLSPSRLTHLLTGLENKKLIVRKMDENDRRIIKVSLNDDGIIFAKETMDKYMEFHLQIIKLIDKKGLEPMLSCLQDFLDSITRFVNDKLALESPIAKT